MVWHSLDVVPNFLRDDGVETVNLGVFEAELVAKVGVDLQKN